MSLNPSHANEHPHSSDQVSLSASYSDSIAAQAVVEDLQKVGLRPTVIVPSGSWGTDEEPPLPTGGLFEQPLRTAAIGAMALGGLTGLAALIWLDGRGGLVYAAIGCLVGALTGWVGSAMAATAHPARDEDLLAYPGGSLTIEVDAAEPAKASLAESVMGRHGPTWFQARTRPGPRPPEERIMWQHEEGLSPLEAMGSWLEGSGKRPSPPTRGRHLEPGNLRP